MRQMFPNEDGFVTIPAGAETAQTVCGRSMAFNYAVGRFELIDGAVREITDVAAVRQWIELMLRTYLGRFRVYEGYSFGHTGEDLIGLRTVPPGFIHSELAREIREACALCPMIERADDFSFKRTEMGRLLTVTFTVTLRTGEEMEVSGNVG